jgi:hypothetical protein
MLRNDEINAAIERRETELLTAKKMKRGGK